MGALLGPLWGPVLGGGDATPPGVAGCPDGGTIPRAGSLAVGGPLAPTSRGLWRGCAPFPPGGRGLLATAPFFAVLDPCPWSSTLGRWFVACPPLVACKALIWACKATAAGRL